MKWLMGIFFIFSTSASFAVGELQFSGVIDAPEYIYHIGHVEHLYADIAAHTVPQKTWDQFIMGKPRFHLPSSRRGLYGCIHPTTAYYFGDALNDPWVMKIKIRESCRKNAFQVYEDTRDNSPFKKWVLSQKKINKQTISQCSARENGIRYWNVADVNIGSTNGNPCTEILNDYLVAANIGIVVDDEWRDSFYIRDRNCIEDINGTPNDWLINLTQTADLISSEDWYQGGYETVTLIFKRILKESTILNGDSLSIIANKLHELQKIWSPKFDEGIAIKTMTDLTNELLRCQAQGELTQAKSSIDLAKSKVWVSQQLCSSLVKL